MFKSSYIIKKPQFEALKKRHHNSDKVVLLSAKIGSGFQYLQHIIRKYLEPYNLSETIFLHFNQAKKRAWLFDRNVVDNEKIMKDGSF